MRVDKETYLSLDWWTVTMQATPTHLIARVCAAGPSKVVRAPGTGHALQSRQLSTGQGRTKNFQREAILSQSGKHGGVSTQHESPTASKSRGLATRNSGSVFQKRMEEREKVASNAALQGQKGKARTTEKGYNFNTSLTFTSEPDPDVSSQSLLPFCSYMD